MGLLTLSLNVTLDGCMDHQEGIANDGTHAFCTHLTALLLHGFLFNFRVDHASRDVRITEITTV